MSATAPARVLVLDPSVSDAGVDEIRAVASDAIFGMQITRGDGWAAVPLRDGRRLMDAGALERLPAVRRVVEVGAPYRLASRELFDRDLGVDVTRTGPGVAAPPVTFGGGGGLGVIASSRWVSTSVDRFELLAPMLREAGCSAFHAGKMKTESDAGEGAGLTADVLRGLRDAAHEHGLALCAEVWDAGQLPAIAGIADLIQIGSRNMQDFNLLRELGDSGRPVLLRRGPGATVEEFLLAAEYVLVHGNGRVILCESGIRTFDALAKPRFEINAVPLIKQLSHLPLLADPSLTAPHAAAVPAMARAAIAAGADGLSVEVGPREVFDPEGVAIDIDAFHRLVGELRPIARAVGRTVGAPDPAGAPATLPSDVDAVLRVTDRTLAQVIESIAGRAPELDVLEQWRLTPPVPWLSPPLLPGGDILGRCTGYRMGAVRLSRNISYVDLGRIDPTIGALLEATHLNLGQLFVDPRIEKHDFGFGTSDDAGEFDEVFRRCFPDEVNEFHPYVWRRYHASIGGVPMFVVVEALPVPVWERLLQAGSLPALEGEVLA